MPIPRAVPLDRAPLGPLRPVPLLTEEVQQHSKEREQVLDIVGLRRGWRVRPPSPYPDDTAPFTWNEPLLCWTRSVGDKTTDAAWEAWDMQADCWVDGPMYEKNRLVMIDRAKKLVSQRKM